jgi:phosphoglycerol transferase MdoB-like AlkP superfamily enzyme
MNTILTPASLNFLSLFITKDPLDGMNFRNMTGDEKKCLHEIGVVPRDDAEGYRAKDTKLYKRIILVSIESLGRQYISRYNARIPHETTPFLNHMTHRFHTLENFYTSACPTDLALLALLGSRPPGDWLRGETRHETLFSILQRRGYATYFLRNVETHYDNHHIRIPHVYKPQHFIGGETFNRKYPNAERNRWGVSDKTLYAEGIHILEQKREKAVCLFMGTMDTHPGYWFSYPRYPAAVARIPSRALRSLYQMDCEFGEFFTQLMERRLFDADTLLLVFGDHSPAFGIEARELTGHSYFPNLVPLKFVTLGSNPFEAVPRNAFSCQLDLLPTLCAGMGLPVPATVLGNNLLNPHRPEYILQWAPGTEDDILVTTPAESFGVHFKRPPANVREQAARKWLAAKIRSVDAADKCGRQDAGRAKTDSRSCSSGCDSVLEAGKIG